MWQHQRRQGARELAPDATTSLPIPPGFSVGALFGPGSCRLKDVARRSGARVLVDGEGGVITLFGTAAARAAAAADYQAQLDEWRESLVEPCPIPLQSAVILDSLLAQGARFLRAGPADREVTAATELRHPLYALAPSPALAGYEVRLSAALASASLRANADRQVAGPEGDAAAVRELAATCLDAARLLPPGCKLKLHFNLGRQFFRESKTSGPLEERGVMGLSTLQNLDIAEAGDCKSVFSNAVPAASVAALRRRLLASGFARVATRACAVLHINRRSNFAATGIGFVIGSDGRTLQACKVKGGKHKLHFLTHVHGDGKPDLRLRLSVQRTVEKGDSVHGDEVWAAAEGCTLQGGELRLPPSSEEVFKVDTVRRKSKEVYEGEVQAPGGGACTLHVVLSRITRGRLGGEHWEVVGSCPQLRELLNNGGQGAEGEREALLGAILRWCAAVRDAL